MELAYTKNQAMVAGRERLLRNGYVLLQTKEGKDLGFVLQERFQLAVIDLQSKLGIGQEDPPSLV